MMSFAELKQILHGPWPDDALPYPQNIVRKRSFYKKAAGRAREWKSKNPKFAKFQEATETEADLLSKLT